ncbi:MAG: dephospho-CoA kinase [Clostridia bacterium]|nr:dephospho-CoA kinase [Clostridia bacterium]
MKVIGLTGPTGAGKTVVSQMMDLPTVNADQVARQIHKDPVVLAELCERFGNDIVRDGALNRTLLATRAFCTPHDTEDLNNITHPRILEKICLELSRLEQAGHAFCILDAPLLFEAGCYQLCHTTVAVLASRDLRKTRIVERDGISGEMAEQRIAAQHSDEYFKERCEFIVYNSGDIVELNNVAKDILQQIKAKFSIGGSTNG